MKGASHIAVFCILWWMVSAAALAQGKQQKDEIPYKERQRLDRLFIDAGKARILGDYEQALKMFELCLRIDPSQAAAHYELAGLYMQVNDGDRAAEHAREAAKLDPTNYYYRQLYAEILKTVKNYKDAASEFEGVIRDFPEHFETYIELALVYIMQKRYNEAIQAYDRMEAIVGQNEEIKLKKQYLYLQMGDVGRAAAEIEKLILIQPDNHKYYLLLAEVYSINGMSDKAAKAFKRAAERFPRHPEVHLALSDYYHRNHEIQKALDHLVIGLASPDVDIDTKIKSLLSYFSDIEKEPTLTGRIVQLGDTLLAAHPEEAKAYTLNGDIYLNLGKYKEARFFFMKAAERDPTHFAIWNQLLSLEADQEIFDTLLIHCSKALEYFPNQPIIYYFSGYGNTRLKSYEKAISDYQRGIDLTIDNDLLLIQFHLGIGESAHEAGQHERSDKGFEDALRLDSNNTIALNNYSYYLSLRNEKLEKAKKMSARSNEMEPNQPTYLDTYAWVLYQMKNYDEARVWMEKALQSGGGTSGIIIEHMGDILFQLHQQDEAIKYWKRAKDVGGGSELLEKKLKDGKLYE